MLDKAIVLKQIEVMKELRGVTHILFSPEVAAKYTAPFGFKPRTMVYQADGNRDPKGLTLSNGRLEAEGLASWDLAQQICNHLHLQAPGTLGRGSQQRAYCETVIRHLEIKLEHDKNVSDPNEVA